MTNEIPADAPWMPSIAASGGRQAPRRIRARLATRAKDGGAVIRDRRGQLRDLVLLANPVADQWSAMTTAGIQEVLMSQHWVRFDREKVQWRTSHST